MVERDEPVSVERDGQISVERTDPARIGVEAGRVVGLLTAALALWSLLRAQQSFYESTGTVLDLFGVEGTLPAAALFWGNVVLAAVGRYVVCYVVGSLVGVVYDWLDRPPLVVLAGIVLVVGVVDGLVAVLDTRSLAVGGAYVLAWLSYVPVFAWLFDDDGDEPRTGPRRLGG